MPEPSLDSKDTPLGHVFISYVRDNAAIVDRLADDLKAHGIKVWLDRNNIEPGSRWPVAIRRAIENGAFFIACFSDESNKRDRSYFNEELTFAIDELRKRPSDTSWFIPVLLNETQIPSRRISDVEYLSDIQAVFLYKDWMGAINRILRILDPDQQRVSQLQEMLNPHFPDDCKHSLSLLGTMGAKATSAVYDIQRIFRIGDPGIKVAALTALGNIGRPAAAAVPMLLNIILKGDYGEVTESYYSLAGYNFPESVKSAAKDALLKIRVPVSELIHALETGQHLEHVVEAPTAADTMPGIIASLGHDFLAESISSQYPAAEALKNLGVAAVPFLITALEKQHTEYLPRNTPPGPPHVQPYKLAADVLVAIGREAIPFLVNAIRHSDKNIITQRAEEVLYRLLRALNAD